MKKIIIVIGLCVLVKQLILRIEMGKNNKREITYGEIEGIDYYFDFVSFTDNDEEKLKSLLSKWPAMTEAADISNYKSIDAVFFKTIEEITKYIKIMTREDYNSWETMISKGDVRLRYMVSGYNLDERVLWLFAEASRIVGGHKNGAILYSTPIIKINYGFFLWNF